MGDYNSTARFLAQPTSPTSHTSSRNRSNSPLYIRRSQSSASHRPQTFKQRILDQTTSFQVRFSRLYSRLSLLQKILILFAACTFLVLGVLFLVYNERVFGALAPFAKKWKELRAGWLILWAATFLVSFPPLVGHSSCATLAGFVFGVWEGWLIAASATILGSTASFIASRYLFSGYVSRHTANDTRFAALALTLKHDGLKILIMFRLCPLPYSFSNGAISTIPTIQPLTFMLATACAAPKLILHVFVGSRLRAIADSGDKMDARTKAVSYLSIVIGVAAGIATGWVMYTKTKARASELEAEERESAIRTTPRPDDEEQGFGEGEYEYSDDAAEREATRAIRQDDDGISLHTHERDGGGGYRDGFSDDSGGSDARSLDDVFRDGDGEEFGDDGADGEVGEPKR